MTYYSELKFQGNWRDYQQGVLDGLAGHLADSRLHVVAAPGSGKTVLGLELLRQIGRPALILAPTITIRNQWIDRLCSMFLPALHRRPEWISTSIATPGILTVTTYQALHSAARNSRLPVPPEEGLPDDSIEDPDPPTSGEELSALIAHFNGLGPATLVLDEAHHLRKEWWRALTQLQQALSEVQIVSLTATPPYDVEYGEWVRYESLCGPIDVEIPVPELVQKGDLCPHDDFIHFSYPKDAEAALVSDYRSSIWALIEGLKQDGELIQALLDHPWMIDPIAHEEEIFENPQFLSAMLIFIRFAGTKVPRAPMKLLGTGRSEIPGVSIPWLQTLLDGLLFSQKDRFATIGEKLKEIRTVLTRLGAIENRRVSLIEERHFYGTIAGSTAKIGSIVEIANVEFASMGDELRMVVLADYVRLADMPARERDEYRPAKLGVVPIFEALRRGNSGIRLGILTGSLVVIPADALVEMRRIATTLHIDPAHIRASELSHDTEYLRVDISGESAQRVVQLVTCLFNEGQVTLLVGTQALLGEGWDAPTINTLVLASYVGSYMLSNQMRGRAIRVDPHRPHKVANIWHLATITPPATDTYEHSLWGEDRGGGSLDPIGCWLGPDMEMLKRRFRAFEGISYGPEDRIGNGMARLAISGWKWNREETQTLNSAMADRARQRELLADRWKQSLVGKSERPTIRHVARMRRAPRIVRFADTIEYLAITGFLGALLPAGNALRNHMPGTWTNALLLLIGLAFLYALPKLGKALYLLVRNGTLERSIEQVGRALIDSLQEAYLLSTPGEYIHVEAPRGLLGDYRIQVLGGSRHEETMILNGLEEILGPIENPRYLIVRKSLLGPWLRADYHAVPSVLGSKKENAECFERAWANRVGRIDLVYSRTTKGRRILLKARARSLASGFRSPFEQLSVWE